MSANWKGHEEISASYWTEVVNNRRDGLTFEIDIKYAWDLFVRQRRRCALSGLPIQFEDTQRPDVPRTASLDRKDSSLNYTRDNVQWVHRDLNWMKNKFPQDYFIKMCCEVADFSRALSGSNTP